MMSETSILNVLFVLVGVVAADSGFYQFLESLGSREMIQRLAANGTVNPYVQDLSMMEDMAPFTTPYTASSSCSDPLSLFCDMEALLAFKLSMSSSAQDSLSSWQGTNPCDGQWKGVKCEEVFPGMPRVVQIQLGQFYYTKHEEEERWLEMFNAQHVPYMNCEINEEIGEKMSFLQVLNLKGCDVHGLPESLGQLSKMQVLSLANNDLQGPSAEKPTIPSWFSNFQDIRVIDLENTGITGELPVELSQWPLIELANFYFNHLSGSVPSEYVSWIDPSSYPHLHYFLVGSSDHSTGLCISQETKTAFEEAVVMGGTDVIFLPICEDLQSYEQLVKK